jgi:hypothetical protein
MARPRTYSDAGHLGINGGGFLGPANREEEEGQERENVSQGRINSIRLMRLGECPNLVKAFHCSRLVGYIETISRRSFTLFDGCLVKTDDIRRLDKVYGLPFERGQSIADSAD